MKKKSKKGDQHSVSPVFGHDFKILDDCYSWEEIIIKGKYYILMTCCDPVLLQSALRGNTVNSKRKSTCCEDSEKPRVKS